MKLLITGPPRSGTSLLHSLLDAHPDIELEFERPIRELDIKLVSFLYSTQQLFSLDKYDRMEAIEKLRGRLVTYQKIYRSRDYKNEVFEHIKKTILNSFWGEENNNEKNGNIINGTKLCIPNQIEYVGIKKALNKKWKAIFIYRDGRDCVLSMMRRWEDTLDRACYRWNRAIDIMLKCLEEYPNRCLAVPYEFLLMFHEKTLVRICQFLDLDFDENMLVGYKDIKIYKNKRNKLDKSRAFAYKREKDKKLILTIEKLTKKNIETTKILRETFKEEL